jgi:hypothetical protein
MSPRPDMPYPMADHQTRIAVLEEKLDSLHDAHVERDDRIARALDGLRDQIIKQNGRVRRMEVWKDRIQGAMAVLMVAMPVITGFVVNTITK